MTDTGYLIWMIVTAIMIITVLTVGTLAAAGMLGRDTSDEHAQQQRAADDARAPRAKQADRTAA